MRRLSGETRGAFTLIEIMIAISLLMLIVAAIYTSWSAILRGTQVGLKAAEEAQRKRVAMRVVEDSLKCAQHFQANRDLYAFVADTSNEDYASLSFVAHLPWSFPRSGRYGEHRLRRVTFTVEPGKDSDKQLMMRQTPLLMETDPEEEENPLVLAKDVRLFVLEFWNPRMEQWEMEWPNTNQIPPIMRVTLATQDEEKSSQKLRPEDVVSHAIRISAESVPAQMQSAQRQSPAVRGRRVRQNTGGDNAGDETLQNNRGNPRSNRAPPGRFRNRFRGGGGGR